MMYKKYWRRMYSNETRLNPEGKSYIIGYTKGYFAQAFLKNPNQFPNITFLIS